jgi:hypothetical protein
LAGTVTATQSGATAAGMSLKVMVLTNAAVAATPATAKTNSSHNVSIVTTAAGSMVFGAISEGNVTTSPPMEPLCTLISTFTDAANSNQYSSYRTTNVTGTPGSTLVGSTAASGGIGDGVSAMEVLASGGTLTLDGSAPVNATGSGTALTCASFNPPAGSILLAIVVTNASGATAPGMTITSTLGVTWTLGINANASSGGFAPNCGVWYASMGAAAASILPQQARHRTPALFTRIAPSRRSAVYSR